MLDNKKILALQESTGHSVFSPSSMKRIILCPGSVLAELHAPIPESSVYAEKGTLLHSYCEDAMNKSPNNPVLYANNQPWESEDKVLVIDALEYVMGVIAKHTGRVVIKLEAQGTLANWGMPEVYGTMDVQIISDTRIDVLDYKFGYGIRVSALNNPQCVCYLASSVPYGDGSKPTPSLHVHIVQPPLDNYDVWDVEFEELIAETTIIRNALEAAKQANPDYAPSMEACRWCNAKMLCNYRKQSVREKANSVIRASKNPADTSKAQWKIILDAADDIGQAIKDVRAYAQAEIRSGKGFPGYKLVNGRSVRKFSDKEEGEKFIKEYLGEKATLPAPVVSLAQAEKILPGLKKNDEWKALITKPAGKAVLVAESDKRTALVFGVESDFGDDAAEIGEVNQVVGAFDK